MKKQWIMSLPLLLLASLCQAWTTDELQALAQLEANASQGLSEPERHAIFEKSRQDQQWATQLQDQAMSKLKPQNPKAQASGVVIFASLGMPETSLKQLLTQAADLNIPVVIRGLWKNDFMATAQKVKSLVVEPNGNTVLGGVEINPIWFKQFNITQVPAFVTIKDGACLGEPPCAKDHYDRLYGNVSLYHALETLAKHGQHHQVAERYLHTR